MMRPSSEKPDVNWNNHPPVQEDAGENVFDDELIDDPESKARSAAVRMAPWLWGAAAFAGVVAVGLVLRSRRRKPRWPALLNVTIAPAASAPARSAMLSTLGGAAARFAFERLMAAQREALANIEPDVDGEAWKAEADPATRSGAQNGYPRP